MFVRVLFACDERAQFQFSDIHGLTCSTNYELNDEPSFRQLPILYLKSIENGIASAERDSMLFCMFTLQMLNRFYAIQSNGIESDKILITEWMDIYKLVPRCLIYVVWESDGYSKRLNEYNNRYEG